MKSKFTILLVAGSLGLVSNLYAQMSLSGEIRPRTEYRHGYSTLIEKGQSAALFTSQRTRLNVGYANEKFKTGIVLQDVRVWGNQSQMNVFDINTSSLHEAWGEYFFMKRFSLKAGRQELSYDDERILGAVGWKQQGRSHDAFLFKYTDSTFTAHVGAAYNQNGENMIATPYTVANYKEMYFLWLNKKLGNFNISVLELNNGYQSPNSVNNTFFSYTAGAFVEYKKNALYTCVRYYNQGGVNGAKKKIRAYMVGADLQYTIQKKFMVGIGAELLSGQSQTDTTKAYLDVVHYFNPLYGTGHKFNGYMDYYFAGSPNSNVGVRDFYLKTKYIGKKWWVALDAHKFYTGYATDANLGIEIDLTYSYTLSQAFNLQAGYSQMFFTTVTESIKHVSSPASTQSWAYLMLTFKPNFLK